MEIAYLIKKMKTINSVIIDFIEAIDDHHSEFKTLIEVLEKQEILKNVDEVRLLFQLISKIADNHHRTSDFFDKLEKIFEYLIKDSYSTITYFIPNYKKYNKRIIFLLLDKGFVKPDGKFLKKYIKSKNKAIKALEYTSLDPQSKTNKEIYQSYYYLYPKLKEFLEDKIQKKIEEEISEKFKEEKISKFEEKCRIGENDSYICSLIRSDSVEEFISYTNRINLSLTSTIKPSIYETHSLLINKEPTLIEYAAFFGSIQIIQYLKYSKVKLTSSLWFYAIHSNNAELIHLLEENEVKPAKEFVLVESIKCHHNAISNYIINNFCDNCDVTTNNSILKYINSIIIDSLNFIFFPNDIISMICEPVKRKGFYLSQLCFFLTTITIPSSVTSIEEGAFSECSSLEQITIPSSVTKIGDNSFSECSSLEQITIPSSVTKIGDNSFSECSSLEQITIPSSVTEIGDNAFSKCSILMLITIPSSVTSIGDHAFDKCSFLMQVTFIIPSSVTKIGDYVFFYCKSLTQITIPSSVTSIGDYTFSKCSSLKQITIPSSVTSIGDYAFSKCSSLKQISFETPSSVISIGNYAFAECSSLIQITIPSSVTSIGNHAFHNCSSLTQISFEIPSSLTSIGNYAFFECLSLAQITIPSSVTSIGYYIFNGCPLISDDIKESINKT